MNVNYHMYQFNIWKNNLPIDSWSTFPQEISDYVIQGTVNQIITDDDEIVYQNCFLLNGRDIDEYDLTAFVRKRMSSRKKAA